jgi:O-antigen ligase
VATEGLLSLAAACALLGILQLTGISARPMESDTARTTAFGFQTNTLAMLLTLGVLAFLGATLGRSKAILKHPLIAWPGILLICATILATGSRSGLLALVAGLMAFALKKSNFLGYLRMGLVVSLGLGLVGFVGYQSEMVRVRFEKSVQEGNLAGRESIYPICVQMISERPWLGWGPLANTYEVASRLRNQRVARKDSHNFLLHLLTTTGLMGTIPFMAGTLMCVGAAWRSRSGPHGAAPFAMLVSAFVYILGHTWIDSKLAWLILAYALASASLVPTTVARPAAVARRAPGARLLPMPER